MDSWSIWVYYMYLPLGEVMSLIGKVCLRPGRGWWGEAITDRHEMNEMMGWIDRWMDEWDVLIGGWMDGWDDVLMDGWMRWCIDRWMNGWDVWMDGWDGWMNGMMYWWVDEWDGWMGCIDRWMNAWMDGWMDGWMGWCIDRWIMSSNNRVCEQASIRTRELEDEGEETDCIRCRELQVHLLTANEGR